MLLSSSRTISEASGAACDGRDDARRSAMVDRSVGGAWRSFIAGNCPSMDRNVDFQKLRNLVNWGRLIDLRGPGAKGS